MSIAAKAYRLLRAVLTTAVEDDKILPRNPCRIRGVGTEDAGERPVLTVAQVFELAGHVGRMRYAALARPSRTPSIPRCRLSTARMAMTTALPGRWSRQANGPGVR